MPRVALLPDGLVNQIAAGEVVERPASVVKELVENALDAGARRVEVAIEGGGVARLSVEDDGCGMGKEDALLALERHATSKIRSFEDLVAIGTLGFRGEALPSIASVSRLTLTTSPDESGLGTLVTAGRGAPAEARPERSAKGTRVVVEELFANVPARRKFLKGAEAELRAILRTSTALALARPDVAFTVRSPGRTHLELAPAKGDLARFAEVLGASGADAPLAVSFALGDFTLTGAVTPPSLTYASRASQWLFVNRRSVKDATAAHAAALAAREVLKSDRFPGFVLFLDCPPETCDVNVHPQKTEVRFRDPSTLHSLVHRGLAAALLGAKGTTTLRGSSLVARSAPAFAPPLNARFARRSGPVAIGAPIARSVSEALEGYGSLVGAGGATGGSGAVARSAAYAEPEPIASPAGALTLLGQYKESYLLSEGADGLVLVDQHAAHERVRYESIRARLAARAASSQRLLLPVRFEARADEAELLARSAEGLLAEAGFVVSELSGRVFVVSAAPADCPASAIPRVLRDLLESLAESGESSPSARDALAASLACRGAVTVHTRLGHAEAARLLADLSLCADPYTCAHGRPTMLTLPHPELLRRFGRTSG